MVSDIIDSKLQKHLADLRNSYEVIAEINLNHWYDFDFHQRQPWLRKQLLECYRKEYLPQQRIVCYLTVGDEYVNANDDVGVILKKLQVNLNKIDISNFFVIVVLNDPVNKDGLLSGLLKLSTDPTPLTVQYYSNELTGKKIVDAEAKANIRSNAYKYDSTDPVEILLEDLTEQERFLLDESKVFCIYPWVHIHAYPTGQAYPCCMADMQDGEIGNCKTNTLEEIWNGPKMKQMRVDLLNEQPHQACVRCYEKESAGFFSGRKSANKHHGHHINRIHETADDGTLDRFEIIYWDIRFSNLCNLKCRSCGHIFSSSWYQDQIKLAGPEWAEKHKPLFYAGRTETDIWEQLIPHLDHVEQIYFAGGEPLMMDEHYRILEELERRGRFDVRLIYNTNFTQVKLKDRLVFDYWRKFDSVAVGASLDAMGEHAEYIRKGTDWAQVEGNRRKMLEICPNVDFYISPTLSILNAWHLPDFHRDWVEKGLIRPQDLNVNVLQDPEVYRIDIAPAAYKEQLKEKYQQHLQWLSSQDSLNRASVGFQAAINFMMATDNTHLIDAFWRKTHQLDEIRNEDVLSIIPELKALQ